MTHKIGPKEQQRIDLRLKRYYESGPGRRPFLQKAIEKSLPAIKQQLTEAVAKAISKPNKAPVEASAQPEETTMKKKTKLKAVSTGKANSFKIAGLAKAKKRSVGEAAANLRKAKTGGARPGKSANASISKAKSADARARSSDRKVVPALDVAKFVAREGGASMAELVAEFGIEAHPMRAKIHYIKNQIAGWSVENKEGRYYATGPAA